MPNAEVATTGKDLLTPALTAIVVGVGTLVTQWLNRRHGRSKDKAGGTVLERIEKKIDENHTEVRATCQLLATQIEEVNKTATKALHHVVGPDGDNGVRSRVEKLELLQEAEIARQRDELDRLRDQRHLLGPGDVGSLTPRPA